MAHSMSYMVDAANGVGLATPAGRLASQRRHCEILATGATIGTPKKRAQDRAEDVTKTNSITQVRLQQISDALANAPAPEPLYTISRALQEMRGRLMQLKETGHTNASIVAVLATTGLQVSERQVGRALRGTLNASTAVRKAQRRQGGEARKTTSRKEVKETKTNSMPARTDPSGLEAHQVIPVLARIGDADSRIGPDDL